MPRTPDATNIGYFPVMDSIYKPQMYISFSFCSREVVS